MNVNYAINLNRLMLVFVFLGLNTLLIFYFNLLLD